MLQEERRSMRYSKYACYFLSARLGQNELDKQSTQPSATNLLINRKRTNLGKVRSVILKGHTASYLAFFFENEEFRYVLADVFLCARQ